METLDIDYLKSNIQQILDRVHINANKRRINDKKHDRLSFACPICGDSHNDSKLKRGHLFFNNLYYKCYNENCRSTFTKLCNDFGVQLDPNKKLALINYIDTNFHKHRQADDDMIMGNMTKLIPMPDLQAWFDSGKGGLKGFQPVQFGSAVYCYLLERGIPKDLITTLFYEGIKELGRFYEPTVVFINRIGDKIIGIQERNLKKGIYRKFKIWTFKELYEGVYDTELDEIEAISYNKLSYLFNILNVNYEREITIFEGYLDSLFMPNSIGAVGVNTDYKFLMNHDLEIRFFFDNDDAGKKKSHEMLKKGYKVFLWEKYINALAKKETDPHTFKRWFNNNIKDLNKLMALLPTHWKELNIYFSNDIFDSLYLTYTKFQKNKPKPISDPNIHKQNWDRQIKDLWKRQ